MYNNYCQYKICVSVYEICQFEKRKKSMARQLGIVSPINVIKTINVIPTISVINFNYKCNNPTHHKCNKI